MHTWINTASLSQLILTCGLYLGGMTIVGLVIGFWLEYSTLGQQYRITAMPLKPDQLRIEAFSNVRFTLMATLIIAGVISLGYIPAAPFTWGGGVFSFLACYLSFDAYYYVMHRLMHTRALVRFHRYHHYSQVTTPLTGLSMSGVETLGWIGGFLLAPLVIAHWIPLVYEGWMFYMVFNWVGNVIGHANVELSPAVMARPSFSLFAHPLTYHALHHARFQKHYAFGSTLFDRWFGTEWEDWPRLFLRVREGQPIRKLNEKG